MAQGWPKPEIIAEETRAEGVMGLFGGKEILFAVVAQKHSNNRFSNRAMNCSMQPSTEGWTLARTAAV